VCFYCGCNKIGTRDRSRATRYVDYLEMEIHLQARLLGDRRVRAMHWGGGTPTFLLEEDLRRLARMFRDAFDFQPGAEVAIEIDPRSCGAERMNVLAEAGFNRASFGIQDFDPEVQRAVNRIQPYELTRDAIQAARDLGFKSVNADLIYGLPKQSVESFTRTVESVLALRPDRIALYSYAHLPTRLQAADAHRVRRPSRRRDKARDPHARDRALQRRGLRVYRHGPLRAADDELARAQRNGTLIRNFQGYAVGPDTDLSPSASPRSPRSARPTARMRRT
jgi:oxygen-independent coproporphyrinogen-3 oxidase